MSKLNPSDTKTLDALRRLTVSQMRLNPKVDKAIRQTCVDIYVESLGDMSGDDLRETLAEHYTGESPAFNVKRASSVAVFEELAALHCVYGEDDYAVAENRNGLLQALAECGVRS